MTLANHQSETPSLVTTFMNIARDLDATLWVEYEPLDNGYSLALLVYELADGLTTSRIGKPFHIPNDNFITVSGLITQTQSINLSECSTDTIDRLFDNVTFEFALA
jgi:hypothetical protein